NLGRDVRYLVDYTRNTPRTRFNVAVSNHRSYGTSSLSLSDVKAVAKARNATINDVVLALCAGALRRYLIEHKSLPDLRLTAAVPASLRAPGDTRLNNQVVFSLCRLATDVSDPLARLAAAQIAAREGKDLFADVKDLLSTDISVLGAPIVTTAFFRLLQRTYPVWCNVVISNLPGPRQPMYFAGAAARHYFPVVDTVPWLCAKHHRAELPRFARVRIDRVPSGGARRATHRRLSGRGFQGDAAGPRCAQRARRDRSYCYSGARAY